MEVLQAILQRRSVRSYLDRQVPEELLDAVLAAARMAPSGMNARHNRIYVLRSQERIAALNRAVALATKNGNADGVDPARAAKTDPERFCFTYGAPTVLVITAPEDAYNALADAGCLLENAMLQAAALGLGSCWLNNVRRTRRDPGVAAFLRSRGVGENEQVTGGLARGYPAKAPASAPTETGNEVVLVDGK